MKEYVGIRRISEFSHKDKSFVVVYSNQFKRYLTVKKEDISSENTLLKVYNGFTGHAAETEEKAIENRKQAVDIDELIDAGYTQEQAITKVIFGINI